MAKKKPIYFWLRLDNNFYKNLAIKKVRKLAGGDTMVVIYQKMMLSSLETNGVIYYEGLYGKLEEELALMIDEDVDQVAMTLAYFTKSGLIQIEDGQNVKMAQVPALISQETNWARYKRESRKQEKLDNVQPKSNGRPTEIELEKEIDKDKEIDTPKPPEGYSKKSRKSSGITKQEEKDFEALWKLYPCKEGKIPAKRAYVKAVRDGVTNKTIQDGIVAYAKKVSAENTEKKYMKNGDTFFRNRVWEDDLTPSVTTGRNGKPGQKQEPPMAKNEVPASSEKVDMQAVKGMLKGIKTSG
ncbi:phage replisome organizer N-terminal domain-containing protein [Fructobacillus fructosus]|uniref:phage replisome organizer N-terminal domain-containing protein n=1 Tax=Fructobacillus fructosus TaxID=1631 RepID=UPI00200B7D54|nr:phage replisome organizer N-terminal domain-containing protein [Fructobacillus fructosus]MCK8639050.1 phage replisome organizer N-terminal domain-containing protein [Fructobacillus fructosus]